MKNIKTKIRIAGLSVIVILIFSLSVVNINTVATNSEMLSNKKIGWGIKRNDNHEQPDLGKTNQTLLEENKGICLGSNEKKNIYLTFDEGYEAGYTPKILDVLKQNNVKATFFITAHYLNTQSDLVKQMIDEGHIVGNQFPLSQMYQI